MRYFLRLWTDHDTGTDREISRSNYPEYREDPVHPAWFPAPQLGAPRAWSSRYIVEHDTGNPVAYATLWEVRSGRYRFDLAVRPESRRHGVGTDLLARVISDAEAFGATGLQARVRDDKRDALEFVDRRGFREVQRMGAYRLDFADIERVVAEHAFARLQQRGIGVTSLAAVRADDSEYLHRLLELYSATCDGWPDPDPAPSPTPISIDQLRRRLDNCRLSEAFFIATYKQRYIAFTSFFGIGTAVHPEFRHQGIATLLKAGSIADAQGRGFQGQTTSTASRGMQQVLERLGYRRLWSEVRLLRDLKPGNVMATKSGAVLLDFGLAQPLAGAAFTGSESPCASTAETQDFAVDGTLKGTLPYMAPEQLEGREAATVCRHSRSVGRRPR